MRWASASLMFVIVMAMCFSLFIVWNWVLYNPNTGVETTLNEFAQERFNANYIDWWDSIQNNLKAGFGLAGIVCMFLAIICYIADVFSKTTQVYE